MRKSTPFSTRPISLKLMTILCLVAALASMSAAQRRRGGGRTGGANSAQAEASKFWNNYAPLCGGSHYLRKQNDIFIELRGFQITMNYDSLSEADRLNGIEARGVSRFSATSSRPIVSGSRGAWQSGLPSDANLINSVRFQKTRGGWRFTGTGYFNDYARRMTCADLPGSRASVERLEYPSNSIRIDATHVFPIKEFAFWESNTSLTGEQFPQSTTTFVSWKIIYQETAFDYKLSNLEQYWYDADGKQMAYIDTANFSNTGAGQLWWGRGWAEPGQWAIGTYRVKIYLAKQLVADHTFRIVADEQMPGAARFDGLYYKKSEAGKYWFLRFFPNGTFRDLSGDAGATPEIAIERAWRCTDDRILAYSNFESYCKNLALGEGNYRANGSRIEMTATPKLNVGKVKAVSYKGAFTGASLTIDWNNGIKSGSDKLVYARCPYRNC